jgi:hypothetical protein
MACGAMLSSLLIAVKFVSVVCTTPIISSIPTSQWRSLNDSVHGRLYETRPLALPCFSSWNGVPVVPNQEECAAIEAGYKDEGSMPAMLAHCNVSDYALTSGHCLPRTAFRQGFFSASMESQWETCQSTNRGCLLDGYDPTNATSFAPPAVCYQGSISNFYVGKP